MSSISLEQLLTDARKLSTRLKTHDQNASSTLVAAECVLKNVEAMREFHEDLDQLNAVANNRPRTQLVIGIQQENRRIRQLQNENKELRAALEESQNAVELIMSKYRQQVDFLVNTTKLDKNIINHQKSKLLQDKTDKICEMAIVMQRSIEMDEEAAKNDQELQARLIKENQGLRELLEISRRNGSLQTPLARPRLVHKDCQTDQDMTTTVTELHDSSKPIVNCSKQNGGSNHVPLTSSPTVLTSPTSSSRPESACSVISVIMNGSCQTNPVPNSGFSLPSPDSESSSEDEVTFNTIKRNAGRRIVEKVNGNGGDQEDNNGHEEEGQETKFSAIINGEDNKMEGTGSDCDLSAKLPSLKMENVGALDSVSEPSENIQ